MRRDETGSKITPHDKIVAQARVSTVITLSRFSYIQKFRLSKFIKDIYMQYNNVTKSMNVQPIFINPKILEIIVYLI